MTINKTALCIVNYNILVPHWAEQEKPSLHQMPWEQRKEKLAERILQLQPDCICLQEVEKFQEIQDCMTRHGYKGIFAQRNNSEEEGCAIFYKEDAFEVLSSQASYFNDGTGRMILCAEVKPKNGDESFHLINSHAIWDSSNPERRRQEIKGIENLAFEKSQQGNPVIVCADLNTARDENGFLNGFSEKGFEDTLIKSGNSWKNSFVEKGSNGQKHFTTYDYIFSKNIELLNADISGNPNDLKDDLEQGSVKEPSDHLPMMANFRLKSAPAKEDKIQVALKRFALNLEKGPINKNSLFELPVELREALKWGFWLFEGMPQEDDDFGTRFFLENPTHPTVLKTIQETQCNGLAVTSPNLKKEIESLLTNLNSSLSNNDLLRAFDQLSEQTRELIKKSLWVKASKPTDKGPDFSGDLIRSNPRDPLLLTVVKTLCEKIYV